MSAELELASWRRMTSELYAAVRAADDPQRGHALWQPTPSQHVSTFCRQSWHHRAERIQKRRFGRPVREHDRITELLAS